MMPITIDGTFCWAEAPWLTWADIRFGFDKAYIDANSVVQFASASLSIESSSLQYDLATSDPSDTEEIKKILNELCKASTNADVSDLRPWVFLFLKKLFVDRAQFKDPLAMIDIMYADLDYPDYMSQIIRYMPVPDGAAAGEDEITKKWLSLLDALPKQVNFDRHNHSDERL